MSDPTNLKETIDALGTAFEDFKKNNDTRLKEIETKGAASSDTIEKQKAIEKRLDELTDLKSRLEKVEVKQDRPTNPNAVNDQNESKEELEYREAFLDYVRFGKHNPEVVDGLKRKGMALNEYHRAKNVDFRKKASGSAQVDTINPGDGGYGVPKVISDQITKKLLDISPFRQYAKVVTVGTSDYHELVDKRGETYGWVGETDPRSQTRTPSLADCKPPMGTIYAYPMASEESLQDIFFDVEAWLIGNAVDAFAQGEGVAFATGNGTAKPLGFLNAPSPIVDGWGVSPPRPDFSLQYLPTGVASGFPNDQTGSPKGNPGDLLINLEMSLKPRYRARSSWFMAKNTIATVRRWKDGFGNYLWQPGLAAGKPSQLTGYDLVEAEAMPAIAANSYPILFGDLSQAYLVVDRSGVRMTIDEITLPGFVKFYVRKRVGGKVLNSDAAKLLKCAVS